MVCRTNLAFMAFNVAATFAMPATSPNPARHNYDARQVNLNSGSSCNDLKGAGVLQSSMYDMVDGHDHLQSFMDSHPNEQNFVFDYAGQFGLGQSLGTCSINNPCQRPNCNNLDNPGDADTGAGYCELVSICNLSQTLDAVYHAFTMSRSQFSTLQVALQQTFYPNVELKTLGTKEIFDGFITGVNVLGQFAVFPAFKAAFNLIAGVLTGIKDSIENSDQSLQNIAAIEESANQFIQGALSTIVTANEALFATGSWTDNSTGNVITLLDLFDDGTWVDYRNIAVLNTDQSFRRTDVTTLNNALWTQVVAGVVNFAWKQQRTFIMSYPMSQDDFNNHVAAAGNNDDHLKIYYEGRGIFFQSAQDTPDPPFESEPNNVDPPGWDSLYEYDIDTHDILKSSYDASFNGFDWTPTADNSLLNTDPSTLVLPGIYLPGVFTLAHCGMDSSTPYAGSVDDFFGLLNGPGATYVPYDTVPSFCYCMDLTDTHGKTFREVYDWQDWEARFCTQGQDMPVPGN